MPILYSVVARGTVVLARYASCAGNFAEVTNQILSKIPPHDEKLTYSHGNYLFHYIAENKLVYFCITDDQFQRSNAFLFLEDIQQRFKATFGDSAQTAIAFAMNSDFSKVLANQMKHYSEGNLDNVSKVQGQLEELKDIMVKNIDNITTRGERLELLVDKTENLASGSVSFRTTSRHLQRSLFWKNIKLYVIMGAVLIFVLYLIISMFCGGLAWKSCRA